MNALVVYDSQYGNTERIAEVIADTLRLFGEVRAVRIGAGRPVELEGVDLLVVGCPTQGWKPTPAIQSFLDGVSTDRLRGLAVACFDTRFRMPRWMTGSAAGVMEKKLGARGVSPILPAESFFVKGTEGPLRSGEVERAASWARMLAEKVGAPQPALR